MWNHRNNQPWRSQKRSERERKHTGQIDTICKVTDINGVAFALDINGLPAPITAEIVRQVKKSSLNYTQHIRNSL